MAVDAIGLLNMASSLNRGVDIGGQSLGAPTRFHIGAAVNPFSPDLDAEWRRLDFKIEAGAEYPVGLEQFRYTDVLERIGELGDLFLP